MILYPISSSLCKKCFSTIIHLSRAFFSLRFRFYSISTKKKNERKKGKTLAELRYLLFFSSIHVFDAKDFKRNLTDGN